MSDLARDVAKQIARGQRRRRLLFLALLVALIVLAVMYIRFGGGLGFGGDGKGDGEGSGTAPTVDAGPARCAIRVTAAGVAVDGKPATQAEAVERCRTTTGADVIVTGDARHGDWDALRAALEEAKIPIYTRQR
jgi:hypothetical protein